MGLLAAHCASEAQVPRRGFDVVAFEATYAFPQGDAPAHHNKVRYDSASGEAVVEHTVEGQLDGSSQSFIASESQRLALDAAMQAIDPAQLSESYVQASPAATPMAGATGMRLQLKGASADKTVQIQTLDMNHVPRPLQALYEMSLLGAFSFSGDANALQTTVSLERSGGLPGPYDPNARPCHEMVAMRIVPPLRTRDSVCRDLSGAQPDIIDRTRDAALDAADLASLALLSRTILLDPHQHHASGQTLVADDSDARLELSDQGAVYRVEGPSGDVAYSTQIKALMALFRF
jgi:hypothetical protein